MKLRPDSLHPAEQFDDLDQQHAAGRLGLWVFMANEILFFGGFFCAYAVGRLRYPDAWAAASRELDVVLAGIESTVLIASGFCATLALRAIRQDRMRACARLLWTTAALGVLFLLLHAKEYASEFREGLLPGARFAYAGPHAEHAQLFFFQYYAMTAVHALHVAIGVGLIAWTARRTARGAFCRAHHPPVELGNLYWQFVDVVWIFLFPLFYLVDRSA